MFYFPLTRTNQSAVVRICSHIPTTTITKTCFLRVHIELSAPWGCALATSRVTVGDTITLTRNSELTWFRGSMDERKK